MKYLLFFLFSIIFCEKSDVYFTKNITSEAIVTLFDKLNVKLTGKIGLKVHSGEPGGYFLKPTFLKDIYDYTKGTFIESNTVYGQRRNTNTHKQLLKSLGWFDNDGRFEILDEDPNQDITLEFKNYKKISRNYVGQNLNKYDSCVVLSHFKGSIIGYGGALKQLSIGFSSTKGKYWVHSAGKYTNGLSFANNEEFTTSMADAASGVINHFKSRGDIAYINVLANISLDCDCHGSDSRAPQIRDIGILASMDPVAIDQACIDLIKKTNDKGTQTFLGEIEKYQGENLIKRAVELNLGNEEYNLIKLDGNDDNDDDDNDDDDNDDDNNDDDDNDDDDNDYGRYDRNHSSFIRPLFGLYLLLYLFI